LASLDIGFLSGHSLSFLPKYYDRKKKILINQQGILMSFHGFTGKVGKK
jgi:hypothetical protein